MDQVDIDNVEDLNELEARLYAQIHHEATEKSDVENVSQNDGLDIINTNSSIKDAGDSYKNYETSSNTNRILSRRYWASGENSKQQQQTQTQQYQQNTKQRFIHNPFKTPNPQNDQQTNYPPSSADKSQNQQQQEKKIENPLNIAAKTNEQLKSTQHINKSQAGLFANQHNQLQKQKHLEDKNQKSKITKNTLASASKIIDLDTDNESDGSDIIMIPRAPTPIYTLDDSDDEVEHEENDLDSSLINYKADKLLDKSLRCISPSSTHSLNNFREGSLLDCGKEKMSGENVKNNDLLEVPETQKEAVNHEINKEIVETNENVKIIKTGKTVDAEINMKQEEHLPVEIVETNDSLELASSKSSKQQSLPKDCRVNHSQFRVLDVYESETEMTDSVFAKESNKTTVIRKIDTSSDELENMSSCSSQRTKRLLKRNKASDSDVIILESMSSSDSETDDKDVVEDDNEVLRTPIPFIAKGPAVERYKPRKRNRSLLYYSPLTHKRKTAKTPALTGPMTDTGFIATLNNLAESQEGALAKQGKQNLEEDDGDDSETENIPTARDIAEKILNCHNDSEKSKNTPAVEMAVTEDVLNELDEVFESIEQQLDSRNARITQLSKNDDTVEISDSSDSDLEMHSVIVL